ncbi:HEPN-associated N-terminal domain-containing protein [Streptomyces sp. NPDC050400]|uniref:HEPN-associated N-terminal domain-containing protein n=1 Tax=Streptomyces sp. NPDC050400 TaxID=3365610 RepID=UPI003788F560
MGAYEVEEAQAEQGWDYGHGFVCADCVDNEYLARKITAAAGADDVCDYCERAPAAHIDILLEAFYGALHTEYGLASYENAYFAGELAAAQHWEGDDLVNQYVDVLRGERLQETVRSAARDDDFWVERHFIEPRRDRALLDGWERFSDQVKYRTRHVFWLAPPHRDEELLGGGEIPAAAVLDTLGDLIPQVGLVHELPAGHRLWRARVHEEPEQHWHARLLGTALPTQARQPNRMSPAGIPLFYGADTPATALQEVTRHATEPAGLVTRAAFETTRPCRVVDFTRLGPVPDFFDIEQAHLRPVVAFLHQFVQRISADADGLEHLAYVPTQIVTEYLLRVFCQDQPVDGLVFPSSAAEGGICTVLNVPQERCLDPADPEPDRHTALRLVVGTLDANQRLPGD